MNRFPEGNSTIRAASGLHPATRVSFIVVLILLIGYWSFGKAFAYLGIYPIYIGECALVVGVLWWLSCGRLYVPRTLSCVIYLCLLCIVSFQALVSIVFLQQPLMEVVRNISIIYYGLFGLITYTLSGSLASKAPPANILLNVALPRVSVWALSGLTVSAIGYLWFVDKLPVFPKTDVPILYFKPTDAIMPLIVTIGLWQQGYIKWYYGPWALILIFIAAARSRSALFSFVLALVLLWRLNRRTTALATLIAASVGILVFSGLRIPIGYREVSFKQYVANTVSALRPEAAVELDPSTHNTIVWRLNWWSAILGDAVSHRRILIGLGWGANLANAFGFQTASNPEALTALRHPHNATIGIIARGGWITGLYWALFNTFFLIELGIAMTRRRREALGNDLCRLVWVYAVLALLNSSTDVFLESPQNAIPYWMTVGVGWRLIVGQRVLLEPRPDRGPVGGSL